MRYFEDSGRKLFKGGAALSVLMALVLFVVFSFFPLNKIEDIVFSKYIIIFKIFTGIALLLWAFFMVKAIKATTAERSIFYVCISPVLFFTSLAVVMSQTHILNHNPEYFLESHSSEISADTIIVSDNYMGPAVCWYLKRSDIYILESKGELEYGLNYADAEERFLTFRSFRKMVEDKGRTVQVVLIIGENRFGKFGDNLLKPKIKDIRDRYVFLSY
jgi:4-amino-4-deoxy-L-arabinose transferase